MTARFTEPSKSSRAYQRAVEATAKQLRYSLRVNGIRIRPTHSPAFEAGVRAKIATEDKGQGA